MARGKIKPTELSGRNIYQIKNRVIYSDIFMKHHGYQLTSFDTNAYNIYSLRTMACFVGFIIMWLLSNNMVLSLAIALMAYIIFSSLFYFKYIPTLTRVDNFEKPKRDNYIVTSAKEMSVIRLILIIILSILLSVSFIFYDLSNFEGLYLYVFIGLSIVAGVFAIINIIALIYKIVKK